MATFIKVTGPEGREVEVGADDVQDWIYAAGQHEIDRLDIDHECDCEKCPEPEEIGPHILINCREDAGSLIDLQRIQEICDGLHVSDILARLSA